MQRKAGRPRVIPDELTPKVLDLYKEGLGYRKISKELTRQYGISADWSTVRRLISLAKQKA
jgi:intein-encoded DNA endonuclease-like protein